MVDAAAVIRYYCYCCAPYPKEGEGGERSGLLLRGIGTLARPWDLAKVGCRVGGGAFLISSLCCETLAGKSPGDGDKTAAGMWSERRDEGVS